MRRYLCSISLSCLFYLSTHAQIKVGWLEIPIGDSQYYNAQITLSKANLSGICVLKTKSNRIDGSIVNEFGIKALDFTYDVERHQVKLFDIIQILDKWYIRNILRKDLALLLHEKDISSKCYAKQCQKDGSISLVNKKRKIKYQLIPFHSDEAAQ